MTNENVKVLCNFLGTLVNLDGTRNSWLINLLEQLKENNVDICYFSAYGFDYVQELAQENKINLKADNYFDQGDVCEAAELCRDKGWTPAKVVIITEDYPMENLVSIQGCQGVEWSYSAGNTSQQDVLKTLQKAGYTGPMLN